MRAYDFPFETEEVNDPAVVRAIIEIARLPQPGPLEVQQHGGAFGAVIWGGGYSAVPAWGVGYASDAAVLRGFGVAHILEHYANGRNLIVQCAGLKEQIDHVRRSHGLTSEGKKEFVGYEVLKPLQQSLDRGEWELRPWKAKEKRRPNGHSWAKQSAVEAVKDLASYQPCFRDWAVDHPHHLLIATEKGPARGICMPEWVGVA